MGAKLPENKNTFGRTEPMHWFDTPERFLVNVNYADGVTDEAFPMVLPDGNFRVLRGYATYCLPELRPVPVRSVTFRNRMEGASYVITAMTLNQGEGKHHFPEYLWQPQFAAAKTLPQKDAYIHEVKDGYELCDGRLTMRLNLSKGIKMTALGDCLGDDAPTIAAQSGPVFKYVFVPEGSEESTTVSSEQVKVLEHFVADGVNGRRTLIVTFQGGALQATTEAIAFHGTFRVQVGEEPQLLASLDCEYDGDVPARISPVFPVVTNLRVGDIPDTWVLWLQRGGFLANWNKEWGNLSGHYSMQFTDAFNPAAGLGVMLMTQDKRSITRYWHYSKTDDGVTWDIGTYGRRYEPHEKVQVPPAVLRLHSGDWREASRLYREWLYSWYHPISPRKEWFFKVFSYQQTTATEMYDREIPGKWNVQLAADTFRNRYGYLDLLHIIDFGTTPQYGRVGSYTEYGFGGRQVEREGMNEIKRLGLRSSIYFETYNCDEKTRLGEKNFQAALDRLADQSPRKYPMEGEWNVCPGSETWRNHLVASVAEVCRDMEPDCLYIDQGGHLGPNFECWNPNHGHRVPSSASECEAEFYTQLRRVIPDETVVITEETPNDVNTQFYDGSLTYSVGHNMGTYGGHLTACCIDFLRFWIPSFKQIQLCQYDLYDDVNCWNLLKFPFFNAQGYWWHGGIRGISMIVNPDAVAFVKSVQRVMHEYADCFASQSCEPLLPTLRPEIFCNRFDGEGRSAFTFYNCGPVTRRGPMLEIPHRDGASFIDAFTGKPVKGTFVPERDCDVLEAVVGPHDVACIVATFQR